MIRAHNALRPDAACHSADVMTAPERAAGRRQSHRDVVTVRQLPVGAVRWGDCPEIRRILDLWRGKR